MNQILNAKDVMSHIETIFCDLEQMLNVDSMFHKKMENIHGLEDMNLKCMFPKVSYDDWMVCYNSENEKCYVIDFEDESIREVAITACYRVDGAEILDDKNQMVNTEIMESQLNPSYRGESDDFSSYLFFDVLNDKNE